MTIATVLQRAWYLVQDPGRRCTGNLAVRADGTPCDPTDTAATKWCLAGAVLAASLSNLRLSAAALKVLDQVAEDGIRALGGKGRMSYCTFGERPGFIPKHPDRKDEYYFQGDAQLAWDRDPVNHAEPLFLGAIARLHVELPKTSTD